MTTPPLPDSRSQSPSPPPSAFKKPETEDKRIVSVGGSRMRSEIIISQGKCEIDFYFRNLNILTD